MRRLHVGQVGEVGLAQHQADIRIGDQETVAVDDIRLALVADLDARNDVPDELEIDFGYGHGSRFTSGTNGDGHVRFGFLAEVHWSEPRLALPRVAECGFLRTILARVDDVHAQTGHGDLLAAAGVQLRDVSHLRRLAEQLQEFDAANLDVGGVELRQSGVSQLLLDLMDVLLDPGRRRDRLFVLQVRTAPS